MQLANTKLGQGKTYLVAEIGQNHNGDINLAKKLIDMAAMPIYDGSEWLPGVDAVKFCKRSELVIKATKEFNRPYDNPNSYGKTYREHRLALEFDIGEHRELKSYAEAKGLTYFCSVTDIESVNEMEALNVPFYKVASRDLTNKPLLERLKDTEKPVILSAGMSTAREVLEAVTILEDNYALLICTSEYPTEYSNVKLDHLKAFVNHSYPVGWSDHTKGIAMSVVAVGLGACIVEKHVTLDRSMRGSDHAGALEPAGLWKMVRDIRNLEKALKHKPFYLAAEGVARDTLRRAEGRDYFGQR